MRVIAVLFWTPERKNAKVRHQMVELANRTIVDHLVIHRGIRQVSERAYEKRPKPDTAALRDKQPREDRLHKTIRIYSAIAGKREIA